MRKKGIYGIADNIRRVVRNIFDIRGTISGTSNAGTPAKWLQQFYGGSDTWAGNQVDENSAMEYVSFWVCLKIIRETIASLPIVLYKYTDNGKDRAKDHPGYRLMHLKPNPEQTAFDFIEMVINHYLLYGNTYAEIMRDNSGAIKQLWPLMPWNMEVIRYDGKKYFRYLKPDQTYTTFLSDEILHLSNFTLTGLTGERPMDFISQSVGTGLAVEEFGARFFKNDATPGGIIEMPGNLGRNAENIERFKKSWHEEHGTMANKHRVRILEDGAKFHEISVSPDKAQFLETRKFQRNMVLSFHRLPPHLAGDLEHATYTNIEQQSLEFVQYTMLPHFVRFEQKLTTCLLREDEQEKYFYEIMIDALTRADIKTRYEAYRVGRECGWLSINDVLRKENMNTIDGGDVHHVPLNWVELGAKKPEPATDMDKNQDKEQDKNQDKNQDEETNALIARMKEERTLRSAVTRRNITNSYVRIHTDIIGRIQKREVADIKKNFRKWYLERSKEDFDKWYREYYNNLSEYIQTRVSPVYNALNDQIWGEIEQELHKLNRKDEQEKYVQGYIERYIKEYIRGHKKNIGLAVSEIAKNQVDPESRMTELYESWDKNLANDSHDEAVNASNVFARAIYLLAGVQFLRWVNTGSKPCPYCQELDNKVVGIQDFFIGAGATMRGTDGDLQISENIGHAPLHTGCECQVMAG